MIRRANRVLKIFLPAAAGVALLVAAIAISSIMLIVVRERIAEVGLRKAIGATERQISFQFLMEAVVVTFVSGILGLLLGALVLTVLSQKLHMPSMLTADSILLGLIASILVGVVSSVPRPSRSLSWICAIESECSAPIGARVVRELFFGEQPLGERIQGAGMPFVVIGVLQEKGLDPTGADEDNRILIPILAAQRRLRNVDYLDGIFVQAISKPALGIAEQRVSALLRARHGFDGSSAVDDFAIQSQTVLLETLRETDETFSRLLAGLASLTLGLASIGLFAVSLLSVRERRGEIGLQVMSRDRLLEKLRGLDTDVFDRSIDMLISRVRQKLGDDSRSPRFMKTFWRTGYQFVGKQAT